MRTIRKPRVKDMIVFPLVGGAYNFAEEMAPITAPIPRATKTVPIAVEVVPQSLAMESKVDPIAVRTIPQMPMAIIYPMPRKRRFFSTVFSGSCVEEHFKTWITQMELGPDAEELREYCEGSDWFFTSTTHLLHAIGASQERRRLQVLSVLMVPFACFRRAYVSIKVCSEK